MACYKMMQRCGDDVVVLDRGQYTVCVISLYGCTVTSWRIENIEQLFLSRKSDYEYLKPNRGGISVFFPVYGHWNFGHRHGFAHVLPWSIDKRPEKLPNRDIRAEFTLRDNAFTRSMWSYSFEMKLVITLGEKQLDFKISARNTDKERIKFTLMQPTYYKIDDIDDYEVFGLIDREYFSGDVPRDKRQELPVETRKKVNIDGYVHNIYENSGVHFVKNINSNFYLKILSWNYPDVVLYNPWEKAETFRNFDPDEYRKLITLSPAHVKHRISLGPGGLFEAGQTIKRTRIDKPRLIDWIGYEEPPDDID